MATQQDVLASFGQLTPEEQQRVRVSLGFPPPPEPALGAVWLLLIGGLMVGAILAGIAAYLTFTSANKDAGTVFVGITTTIVGALIGLIAPSPRQ